VKSLGLVVVLAACGFEHGVPAGHGPNDGDIDVPPGVDPDAMPDADPGCFGPAPFVVCPTVQPTQPLDIDSNITTNGTAQSCDTGRGVVMTIAGTESCVLAGTDITFSGSSTRGSSGSRPLVLIATGTITIAEGDTLDARGATIGPGPGSNPSDCGAPPSGMVSGGNGGGGAGGSFGSKGGSGANGGAAAGGPANAAASTPVNKLRGGCPGGSGAGTTVAGGNGGGAVLMIAKTKIQIDGTLTVSGAGGLGGKSAKGGGGGGGSGGMIVLHAPMVSIGDNARLIANGGGGGGGAGAMDDGVSGDDATMLGTAAAGGGTNGPGTTAGGAGAFKATDAVTPANAGGGGGGAGGGGGVGVIRVLSGQTISDNNCSPAATN
jgi:hypothetical protein